MNTRVLAKESRWRWWRENQTKRNQSFWNLSKLAWQVQVCNIHVRNAPALLLLGFLYRVCHHHTAGHWLTDAQVICLSLSLSASFRSLHSPIHLSPSLGIHRRLMLPFGLSFLYRKKKRIWFFFHHKLNSPRSLHFVVGCQLFILVTAPCPAPIDVRSFSQSK